LGKLKLKTQLPKLPPRPYLLPFKVVEVEAGLVVAEQVVEVEQVEVEAEQVAAAEQVVEVR
jgi:hypothetical protein